MTDISLGKISILFNISSFFRHQYFVIVFYPDLLRLYFCKIYWYIFNVSQMINKKQL